jgi:hypothetical protein
MEMARNQTQEGVRVKLQQSHEFLTGHDGHYLRKRTRLFDACVKTPVNPEMPVMQESAKWIAPKIPYAVIADCIAFFRAVWAEHGSEAIALLSLENDRWNAQAPMQEVGPASLSYESIPGLRPVGSIHSHGSMKAFHSGTDLQDASEFDGIHIVVGRLDLPNPEFVAALHVNGKQFPADIREIVEGLPLPQPSGLWHPWLSAVQSTSKEEDIWPTFMEF